ncbi:MAG TPA: ABC transporter substrate-binding protein [Acidimicrobiia bacterium]|nr:ABC transporter substrate-binding protein [Acidimicrobiia bacterium]
MRSRRLVLALLVTTVATTAGLVATVGTSAAAKNVKIKVLLLAETKGESVNAVQYYDNGAKLAAQELGASKVEYTRIPAPLTPAQAQTALLQAIDQKPDVIIGLPASSQVIPLSQTIGQSNIPFFALSTAIQTIKSGPNGAPNLYLIRPLSTDVAAAEAKYVTKDLKAKKIGLVCVQNAFGTDSCNVARPAITAGGGTIAVERSNAITATDLTDIALAMKNVDAVLDFNFPNPLGVLANQLVQNGVNVPHVDGASAGIEVNAKVVQGDALKVFSGVDDCVPVADKSAAGKKFNKAYQAAYSEPPIYSAAEAYDMVKFAYAAAQKAGSTDPAKLEAQVQKMSYTGACGKYKLDSGNILLHTSYITKWSPAGAEKAIKKLTFPVTGAPGSTATTAPTATTAATTPATTTK